MKASTEPDNASWATRYNPFTQASTQDCTIPDEELVAKAQTGDRDALEALVRRHQAWVFNIAIRMVWRRDLYQFMQNKCGLINTANPCRCGKKNTRIYAVRLC